MEQNHASKDDEEEGGEEGGRGWGSGAGNATVASEKMIEKCGTSF